MVNTKKCTPQKSVQVWRPVQLAQGKHLQGQQWHRYRIEDESKLRSDDFFDIESKRTSLFHFILDRRGSKKFIPKLCEANKRRTCLLQNLQDQGGSKKFSQKLFGLKKKRICLFKNLQDLRRSKKFIPKLFRSKKKRTCMFQYVRGSNIKRTKNLKDSSGSKWNGPNCSKTF